MSIQTKLLLFMTCLFHWYCNKPNSPNSLRTAFVATTLNKSGVSLREKPSFESKELAMIEYGSIFEVTQDTGISGEIEKIPYSWLKVKFYDAEGYLRSNYVESLEKLLKEKGEIVESKVTGKWLGHNTWPEGRTTLVIGKNHKFNLILFSGADEGGFDTHTVTGDWNISNGLLILTSDESDGEGNEESQAYLLLEDKLILAKRPRNRSQFMENYSSEYVTGLYRP